MESVVSQIRAAKLAGHVAWTHLKGLASLTMELKLNEVVIGRPDWTQLRDVQFQKCQRIVQLRVENADQYYIDGISI